MHCVSSYPAKNEDLNLSNLNYIKKLFKYDIGYSDHSLGTEAALAAVAMGVKVIEKHVTTSKKLNGPDHKTSITIKEFSNMVKNIRKIEIMLGTPGKKILQSEKNVRDVSRKSIVTRRSLKKNYMQIIPQELPHH